MKKSLLFLVLIIIFYSCNTGVEQKSEAKSKISTEKDSSVNSPGAVSLTNPEKSPSASGSGSGEEIAKVPVQSRNVPDPSAKHQTLKLHPTNKAPDDPTRNLLNAYAKDKVNSVIIPFKKGNDPNLQQSRDLYMSGSRKAREGDHRGAIEDFTKSLALSKNATIFMRRGYSYLLLKDYQSALIDMNEAIKLAPILDKAYFARAVCRFEMEDFKIAEEDLRKFLETDKTNALAYNYLAAIKFMQKNPKEALEYYSEVIKLDPGFPNAYSNRGMMRHNLGDLHGAVQDYNIAIKQNPSDESAYNNKGAAELTLKDYEAALRDLNMAIKIKGDYADAYDNRGKTKLKMGDQQGACEDWHKAYSLGLEASRELIIKFCK